MSQITVVLPDGSPVTVPAGATAGAVAAAISPRLARVALAAVVGDRTIDLSAPVADGSTFRVVTPDSPEALDLVRHSTAHLMAAAVTGLVPDAQCGIGPAIEDGFYYDFVVERPFVPADLEAIEARMREIVAADRPFERRLLPKADAGALFASRGEPLKAELVEEKGGAEVSCYAIDDIFVDFCTGPHVPSTGRLTVFKLLSVSSAYWKGDARNQPMQRIYGTAFLRDADLAAHLRRIEEARKRDHRKLGRDLGLFMFHPWAPGCPFWLDKGTRLVNLLSQYMRDALLAEGYIEVRTPLVFHKALWETSGHWEHYRQNMFLIETEEGEQGGVKAMNCPGHMLVFGSEVRSYRDLPLRIHDQSVLHRMEASGVLSGLTRVREFIMDDAHIFVTEDQIGDEVERLLRLVQRVYGDFGLSPEMKLATRPAEFLGAIAQWDHAEAQLKLALERAGQPYVLNEGDGAFYGPKIDFAVTDAIGRKWQCATIQLDYQLPERFDLHYVGADNAEHRPVVIHRAIYGSIERFVAMLLEHYTGALPLWIAPLQVVVLPIADRHADYARTVRDRLAGVGVRVEVDGRNEKIGYKIREAQLQKVPYMLVVGDREAADGAVAVRSRAAGDLGSRPLDDFVTAVVDETRRKVGTRA